MRECINSLWSCWHKSAFFLRDLTAELLTPCCESVNNQMRDWSCGKKNKNPGSSEALLCICPRSLKGVGEWSTYQHPGQILLELFLCGDQLNAHLCSISIDYFLPFGSEGWLISFLADDHWEQLNSVSAACGSPSPWFTQPRDWTLNLASVSFSFVGNCTRLNRLCWNINKLPSN